MKVETKKRYYCLEPKKLIALAETLNFVKVKERKDIDEYFTDINSEFVKEKIVLRTRKKDNEKLEITYKSKSDRILGVKCKLENNIKVKIEDYDNYVKLFSSLGYYSYVEIYKERIVYQLKNDIYTYNVMLDNLKDLGGFVEFEIISELTNPNKDELRKEMLNFLRKFRELKLVESDLSYRELAANNIYHELFDNKKINNICIDLDLELSKYEKDFYKNYKDEISFICGYNIKWGEYKRNIELNDKIELLIDKYLDNLLFDETNLLVMFNLLNKLSYNRYFITKVNELFVSKFLNKLNLKSNNILCINRNITLNSLLKLNNLNQNNTIFLNDEVKINNRILLIIINNE